jgi:phosphatidylserine decarboxylase
MKNKEIHYIDRKTGKVKVEHPPGESFLKFLYHNPLGKLPLHAIVKRKFLSSLYGSLMNQSHSRNRIINFVKDYSIDMSESEKQIQEFSSFNDFFCRKLKPDSRTIKQGIVSPADGKMLVFETIAELKDFFVKGNAFTLEKYLCNKKLAEKYENASVCIIRLAPYDYHRFHFPYSGKASASIRIKGSYFSVSPISLARNFSEVFCENKRAYTILYTRGRGEILISPVGATMVGAIHLTYDSNKAVKKGDEMGYFAFGGSSILMLLEKDKNKIDSDLVNNTKKGFETKISMGEKICI